MKKLSEVKTIVIKVGSSLVTNGGEGVDIQRLSEWANQIAQIQLKGTQVVLVSSGSIAEGLKRLGWKTRPKSINELQAAAAVGQMGLVQSYEAVFEEYGLHAAQILLTHDDLRNRTRYLNARSTINTLLDHGIVPIVNENDTISTQEIKLGDNDTLGALVTNLIGAELYIILTDQKGLYESDPRIRSDASFVSEIFVDDLNLERMAGGAGSSIGTGGMYTKVTAAKRAGISGAYTVVASGKEDGVILKILNGEAIGTLFKPIHSIYSARQTWILSQLIPSGKIVVDRGAAQAIQNGESSLLAIGCKKVTGKFNRGEIVIIVDENDKEIARGLINYSASEVNQLLGHHSLDIESILGYMVEKEVIHRDNMIVIK